MSVSAAGGSAASTTGDAVPRGRDGGEDAEDGDRATSRLDQPEPGTERSEQRPEDEPEHESEEEPGEEPEGVPAVRDAPAPRDSAHPVPAPSRPDPGPDLGPDLGPDMAADLAADAGPETDGEPGTGRRTGVGARFWEDGLIARRAPSAAGNESAGDVRPDGSLDRPAPAVDLDVRPVAGTGAAYPTPNAPTVPPLTRGRLESPEASALRTRLEALRELVALSRSRLEGTTLAEASRVLDEAGARGRMTAAYTVVAIAGATGGGKSSLFNALAGAQLSEAGTRRPTTALPVACVCQEDEGAASPDGLLERLGIAPRARRRVRPRHPALAGLVLLDLPDHDSVADGRREQVDRMLELVDAVIWVVDPEKYADAVLHERYLRPLAGYAEVTYIVLNQVDRLPADAVGQVLHDLRRLLDEDGMAVGEHGEPGATVLALSTVTGEGIDELREALGDLVTRRAAPTLRLAADVDGAVARLRSSFVASAERCPAGLTERAREEFEDRLASAVGAVAEGEAAERAWLRSAERACGTPWTRLLPDRTRRGRGATARGATARGTRRSWAGAPGRFSATGRAAERKDGSAGVRTTVAADGHEGRRAVPSWAADRSVGPVVADFPGGSGGPASSAGVARGSGRRSATGRPGELLRRRFGTEPEGGTRRGPERVTEGEARRPTVARPVLDHAVRALADEAVAGLPDPWAKTVREAAWRGAEGLAEALEECLVTGAKPAGTSEAMASGTAAVGGSAGQSAPVPGRSDASGPHPGPDAGSRRSPDPGAGTACGEGGRESGTAPGTAAGTESGTESGTEPGREPRGAGSAGPAPAGPEPRPRWWLAARGAQLLLAALQLSGLCWLALTLLGVGAGAVTWPLVLAVGGTLGGPAVARACRLAARAPAREHGQREERRLRRVVSGCGRTRVLEPVAAELLRYREVREQYVVASGGSLHHPV